MRICVFADDLTGAADTGVQFAISGRTTWVTHLSPEELGPDDGDGADVVSVGSDTRNLATSAAYQRVLSGGVALSQRCDLLYKKIDSGLRGNVGIELKAIVDAGLELPIPVAPAFPATGRTTESGLQLIDGVRVDEGEMGRDLLSRAETADVRALVGRALRCDERVGLVPLSDVRRGRASVAHALAESRRSGRHVAVCDSVTNDDLLCVAQAALDEGLRCWSGSAGLAAALAKALPSPPPRARRTLRPARGRSLVATVSHKERTARQLDVYAARAEDVVELRLRPADLVQAVEKGGDHVRRLTDGWARRSGHGDVIVRLEPGAGLSDGEDRARAGRLISDALGRIVRGLLETESFERLYVIGGDGLRSSLRCLDCRGFWVYDQPEPGVALGTIDGGPRDGLTLLTKSGAFGGDTAIVDTFAALDKLDESEDSR